MNASSRQSVRGVNYHVKYGDNTTDAAGHLVPLPPKLVRLTSLSKKFGLLFEIGVACLVPA